MQMNIQGVFTEASLTGKLHERTAAVRSSYRDKVSDRNVRRRRRHLAGYVCMDGDGSARQRQQYWYMYEVSNGTGVSSVLSSDIEVVAKRREIMIYVKQPTMYFYIPDRGLLPDYGVWRRRRRVAVGGGGLQVAKDKYCRRYCCLVSNVII